MYMYMYIDLLIHINKFLAIFNFCSHEQNGLFYKHNAYHIKNYLRCKNQVNRDVTYPMVFPLATNNSGSKRACRVHARTSVLNLKHQTVLLIT